MYNTKAFSSKIALKNFRCPQWRRLFCSLRSVLSCCEKAFVNLSRMCVSSKFERDLCPEPCDNAVIRLSVLLSYLICKMLQETLTLISHSAIAWFQTLKVWMNPSLHLAPAAGTCVSSRPLAPWILQMLSCCGNTWS